VLKYHIDEIKLQNLTLVHTFSCQMLISQMYPLSSLLYLKGAKDYGFGSVATQHVVYCIACFYIIVELSAYATVYYFVLELFFIIIIMIL
jgi:hypothetical protein